MQRLGRLLRIESWLKFWGSFMVTMGTISSIVTLISFVFGLKDPNVNVICIYILVVFTSCFLSAWAMSYQKTKLSINVSNNLQVKVASGDLFDMGKEHNFVVIPVNEYFDTIVDRKIVSASSLHGQFIQRFYKYNHTELHSEIESFLRYRNIEGEEVERPNSNGYKTKYPLGTCVSIQRGTVTYVLLALTHFDEQDHAYVELAEFGLCIAKLCKFLANNAEKRPVFMPLMGMGLSRLNQSAQFVLKYTLDTIVGIKDLAIPGGINIVIYPPVAKTLNLNEIRY